MTAVALVEHGGGTSSARTTEGLLVRNLSVQAGTGEHARTLVRELSFALGPGETLGIVGESGSGKSMTARSLVGLLPSGVHASGAAQYDGVPLIGARERVLQRLRGSRISIVLQDPFTMLNPLLTAFETVAESLPTPTRRDRRGRRAEVERRLDEVGVDPHQAGDRYPFQLSGGMRQRVALAAALARDPALLIADEPTTALDVTTQREVLGLLRELQQRRAMALILITHDLGVAFSVCDRVLVLYAGSMMEQGPAARLIESPRHPYTARLRMADPPVTHLVERLGAIPGNVPDADSVANECAFAPRCDWMAEICRAGRPAARLVAAEHESSCVRIAEIQDQLAAALGAPWGLTGTRAAPAAASTVASVRDLRKTYRTVALVGRARTTEALRGVSFEVGADEAVGLVGESGSGKTSIARCLLGLTRPDSGTLRIEDVDISDFAALARSRRDAVRRSVQVVFQDPYASLNPRIAIGDALREAVKAGGVRSGARAEVLDLLDLVGLPSSYLRRRPSALSGGERQRVAIARALAVRPKLLICDEPVAALDVSVQAQILELLREIRRTTGMSMLFITHDLAVVRQMAERVLVLYKGEIVEQGQTDTVLDSPTHPYTKRLIESVIR